MARRYTLSNGSYSVLVTSRGTGFSSWHDLALTAWRDDPVREGPGVFLYVRDAGSGVAWSIGRHPVDRRPERSEVSSRGGVVRFERRDEELDAALEIAVDPSADVEVRRLVLRNGSSATRALELTSYAEIVLAPLAAHLAHPAFSKLFVETAAEGERLIASRRPRGRDERRTWIAHALRGSGDLSWETDRARFVGRGRSPSAPRALSAPLSGAVGSVLDPVFAFRRSFSLEPGEEAAFELVLAAADGRDRALALVDAADAASVLERARSGKLTVAGVDAPEDVLDDAYRPLTSAGEARHGSGEDALVFDNGTGGFSADGSEYVIRVDGADSLPPMPWVNVIANQRFGCLVSERGAATTWSENSRQNRLTPWSNDPVTDPHGEALYVRDEDDRTFWSPLPGPVAPASPFEVRHGLGYSTWRHRIGDLGEEVTTFVAADDPVKIVRLRVTNAGEGPRRLAVFSYAELVLGVLASDPRQVVTAWDPLGRAIFATNALREIGPRVTFAAAVDEPIIAFTTDRRSFLGDGGTPESPAALRSCERLDGRAGDGVDPCAALQVALAVGAGETAECAFLLGEAADEESARMLVERYRAPGAVEHALDAARSRWTDLTSVVRVATPSPAIDLAVNGWLLYQAASCRIWGRTAFYQSGGAFGFRDQLQDSMAMIYAHPDLTRAQILLHAAHQFVEGDVLHWWHPPLEKGTRTRCSDDLLWLPYVTTFYVAATGDAAVLDERTNFVTARELAPGEDETYLEVSPAAETTTVYEHCCRAIERSLRVGGHGLPLIGTCDWNDGFNRVGREGRGESIWLGFFLCAVLDGFAPIAQQRGDEDRARRWRDHRESLAVALDSAGWDGEWYRRAYYDDGTPLGSAENDECRIDALAQSWAVISGVAARERAELAMAAAERELVDDEGRLVRLLAPPFDRTAQDPGYIKGYVPGIRENGGQYTHAACWMVRALAELGRRDRAADLLEMISPASHARTAAEVAVYQVEPYVVAADVYGAPPHVGRGGWTWYTGSAGWLYRVALESVLGFSIDGARAIRLRPRVPDGWRRFSIDYTAPGGTTRYEIHVATTRGRAETVTSLTVDGVRARVTGGEARIPIADDGRTHRVEVRLGRVAQRARARPSSSKR
ncbi:MAG: cyclic beta,2-glucan synthetase [Candidatus Binatota bacterium]|nr:cyclic beta,2-glucan synthetase [Candidatus Binatota bacterium]